MSATAPQTAIATRDAGVPGLVVGSHNVIEPAVNEESTAGIAFGVMVKNGTAFPQVKLCTATSNKFAGVSVFNHAYNRDTEVDTDGLQPKAHFGILTKGEIHVLLEETVAIGNAVRVRCVAAGAEQAGAFRTSADSTDCVDISLYARWRSAGSSGGTAILALDMTGAGSGVAD